MKKKLKLLVAIFLFAAVSIQCTVRYKILHKGRVMIINADSWEKHKAHGDTFLGFVLPGFDDDGHGGGNGGGNGGGHGGHD